ncbi:E3 ubiquitin-protein ligase UHRF1 [Lamellibrachia satsuma]|nr:E3 ubiquitin-protein ligase UHRF1 [Lamellibrachia satsuma]
MPCEYERLRLKNLEDNKRILAQLGLINPFEPLPQVIHDVPKRKRPSSTSRPRKKFIVASDSGEPIPGYGSLHGLRRKSARLEGKAAANEAEIIDGLKEVDGDECRVRVPKDRPNVYGAIPGVEIGTVWQMRIECSRAGVHRPTVAGIHGGPEGAYSLALSGGYEDDIDLGECMTFTGEGGRDLKGTKNNPKNLRTAPQSKDQVLTRGNLALSQSVETGFPVRVIRGYKSRSAYAPEEGYRYDGLYEVERFWYTVGMSGFGVYKFVLTRLKDQPPPPWHYKEEIPRPIEDCADKAKEKDAMPSSHDSGVGSETCSDAGTDVQEVESHGSDVQKSDGRGSDDQEVDRVRSDGAESDD